MPGRIPQHFIDQLLDRTDIVEVIDSRVQLKKSGRNFMACCPFHNEKTPSFSVSSEKQFYHCFGCNAGGNAISFLMDYERMEFPQAIESLAAKAGMEIPRESAEDPDKAKRRKDLYSTLHQVDRYYRKQLRDHPQAATAVDYLKGRGLSGEIAAQFGVGFAPPGWDNVLENFGADNAVKDLLLQSGMLVSRDQSRIYDRFRNRIMFPIRDSRGRTIAFGGRVLGDDKPKYLNSPETPVYHKGRELYGLFEVRSNNRHLERILVVEGYMDVIALAQAGLKNAVATLGTATSSTHIEVLFRHVNEVVFCFDGDKAGQGAARRAMETVLPSMQDGRQIRFLFLPAGEDPDTMVRKEGAPAFEERVAAAMPLSEYIFELAGDGVDVETPDGKAMLSKRAFALIEKLPSGAFREIMQNEVSAHTGLKRDQVVSLMPPVQTATNPSSRRGGGHSAPPPTELPQDAAQPGPFSDAQMPPPEYDSNDIPPPLSADEQYFEPPISDDLSMPAPWDGGGSQRPIHRHPDLETLTLAQAAIALVLHKPLLASSHSADLAPMASLVDGDIQLFLALHAVALKRPDANTGMLLGNWYGSPEYEQLLGLSGRGIELLREASDLLGEAGGENPGFEAGIEQQFIDTVHKLLALPNKQRIQHLLDRARAAQEGHADALSNEELRELEQYWSERKS